MPKHVHTKLYPEMWFSEDSVANEGSNRRLDLLQVHWIFTSTSWLQQALHKNYFAHCSSSTRYHHHHVDLMRTHPKAAFKPWRKDGVKKRIPCRLWSMGVPDRKQIFYVIQTKCFSYCKLTTLSHVGGENISIV